MRIREYITKERADEVKRELMQASNPALADIIERNIAVIELLRREARDARSLQERFTDAMTDFSGSVAFFYVHIVWFGAWIAVNLNWISFIKPFDPFPFGLLTMIVSLEAIFLSTFVLISQNRQAELDKQREALDLQIDLLAEYEITRMLRLVDKMAEKMGIEDAYDAEIDQLCEPVVPEVVMKEIQHRQQQANLKAPKTQKNAK